MPLSFFLSFFLSIYLSIYPSISLSLLSQVLSCPPCGSRLSYPRVCALIALLHVCKRSLGASAFCSSRFALKGPSSSCNAPLTPPPRPPHLPDVERVAKQVPLNERYWSGSGYPGSTMDSVFYLVQSSSQIHSESWRSATASSLRHQCPSLFGQRGSGLQLQMVGTRLNPEVAKVCYAAHMC